MGLLLMAPTAYASQPTITGQYAVSIDAKTGDILFDKNAHQRAFPASMTKVLTGILLLEHTKPGDRIAFSPKALAEEKSNYQIEFQPGETVDRDTALMILMVLSANDMSYAIAEHVSGSIEAFAKLMNEKAQELGAKESHFVTPNGLHNPDHYTTPYDMAMIGRMALRYPELLHAMRTQRTTVTTSNQTVSIFNKAKFFSDPQCVGAKTGFTNQARNTLVKIDRQGENEIVNVVMASHNPAIYEDMRLIANYAFPQFARQSVLDQQTWKQQVSYLDKSVSLELKQGYELSLKQGEGKNVEAVFKPLELHSDKLYNEGIHKGEVLGQVELRKNGQTVGNVEAVSKEDVAFEKPIIKKVTEKTEAYPLWVVLVGTGILLLTFVAIVAIRGRKRRVVVYRR
ncbi:D-alanyl-D-alanine carboxypeptidase [Ectobacillus sp. JY-23]|uniref:D-alanyl-D-alanine carboxypeptidase family protein n=1 Tax=Ectobacillus sp. JY-23 TaxID=2933872 RepID=UPI001FF4ED09|nr:D-alanyl-D-alanine carboxypeptidase family protein [Ectobacillus sp. JY-23]UOY94620.1 D-alanyl-D-alanine carboxypeptidase [Ectobacillus sp. JY-23]